MKNYNKKKFFFLFFFFQANRAQLNHKAFFGGEADEYDLDNNEQTSINLCSSQPTTVTKTAFVVKSKSTDNIRTTTTTIIENGKTKLICPRDQKKVKFSFIIKSNFFFCFCFQRCIQLYQIFDNQQPVKNLEKLKVILMIWNIF